jgi:hypothetical protein
MAVPSYAAHASYMHVENTASARAHTGGAGFVTRMLSSAASNHTMATLRPSLIPWLDAAARSASATIGNNANRRPINCKW